MGADGRCPKCRARTSFVPDWYDEATCLHCGYRIAYLRVRHRRLSFPAVPSANAVDLYKNRRTPKSHETSPVSDSAFVDIAKAADRCPFNCDTCCKRDKCEIWLNHYATKSAKHNLSWVQKEAALQDWLALTN